MRDTALALVASGVGGELIAMPYAMSRLGFYVGFAAIIGIGLLSLFSSMMYIKVKDTIPGNTKSAYEMAHVLFGRPALFVVCIAQYMLVFSDIVLYYIVIGDTLSQLSQ